MKQARNAILFLVEFLFLPDSISISVMRFSLVMASSKRKTEEIGPKDSYVPSKRSKNRPTDQMKWKLIEPFRHVPK